MTDPELYEAYLQRVAEALALAKKLNIQGNAQTWLRDLLEDAVDYTMPPTGWVSNQFSLTVEKVARDAERRLGSGRGLQEATEFNRAFARHAEKSIRKLKTTIASRRKR